VASPFGCRSGHISAFAEATLPRDGQVGEGVSPALDARTDLERRRVMVNLRCAAAITDLEAVTRMPWFSSRPSPSGMRASRWPRQPPHRSATLHYRHPRGEGT
jgi:hypothetical protein